MIRERQRYWPLLSAALSNTKLAFPAIRRQLLDGTRVNEAINRYPHRLLMSRINRQSPVTVSH